MTTEVSEDHAKSKVSEREYVRRTFYKSPIKKDNLRLEVYSDSSQEERRKLMLEHQKRCREQNFDAARGILSYLSELKYEDEEWEDCEDEEWEECEGKEEDYEDYEEDEGCEDYEYYEDHKEIEEHKDHKKSESITSYENYTVNEIFHRFKQMMLSEWMIDVPEDLTENWIMVPCPLGSRRRLISGLGKTRSYNKYGILCNVFDSALPGGSSGYPDSSHAFQHAILDCIWDRTKKIYYVLDLLFWNALPFTDCDVDLRQFWIKSKFAEIENLQDRDTHTNTYPILPLPSINCDSDLSAALENLDPKLFPLDGILFYHRAASYTFMKTPLVTWLKPYMLPEKLGISVSPPLDERPDSYINFEHFMEQINVKKAKYRKIIFKDVEKKDTKIKTEDGKMEIEKIKVEDEDEKEDQKIEIENGSKRQNIEKMKVENEDEKEDQKIEVDIWK